MKSLTRAILLFATLLSVSCTRVNLRTIDDWSTPGDTLLIIVDSSSVFPITIEGFYTASDSNILGQERDVQLYATSGSDGAPVSVSVEGSMSLATPGTGTGGTVTQYDGRDGSMNLNPSGLSGVDLTAFGADAISLFGSTDHPTQVTFTITSDFSHTSTYEMLLPATTEIEEYVLYFKDFDGNADLTNVGSISLEIIADRNIDVILNMVCTSGPDRIYFINPICYEYYDFTAECYEKKVEYPSDISVESSTSSSSSGSEESFGESDVLVSLSILVQQYFTFSWNNFQIVQESNPTHVVYPKTSDISFTSTGSLQAPISIVSVGLCLCLLL
jgi:hypothetical protein